MTEVISLRNEEPEAKGEFCLTPTAQDIINVLSTCQARGWIGVVVGEPGTGKTTAVRAYCKDAEFGVRSCRMTRTAAKLQPGLVRIVNDLGGYVEPNLGADDVYQVLVRLARGAMKGGLIILDEAQHMEDDLLETVRDLYDETRIGIALVGNHELTSRWSDQGNRRRYNKFAQLRGRIGPQVDLRRPLPEDVEAICAHHGIQGKRAVGIVKKTASLPGGLQKVRNLFEVASDLGDGAISLDALQKAAMVVGLRDMS